MNLQIAISPCPNDTFIFFPIILNKIQAHYDYHFSYADVNVLNNCSLQALYDVCKISFAVYPDIAGRYQILDCGAALGRGVGPLLISKQAMTPNQVSNKNTVVLPGELTTAHKLFSRFFPMVHQKHFLPFEQIEQHIVEGKTDLGVIIHENRFTYQQKGLHKIVDLGDCWEQATQAPIPLGGMAVKRALSETAKANILKDIRSSLAYAHKHPEEGMEFIFKQAQIPQREVVLKHIHLYVNSFTDALGDEGRKALRLFFKDEMEHMKNTFIL